jgi:hypothetical protein
MVTDFKHGSDELIFRNADFDLGGDNGLGASMPQQLDPSLFVSNATGAFTDGAQRFAFDTQTRELFYSPAGSSGASSLVAMFGGMSVPTAHDLLFTS